MCNKMIDWHIYLLSAYIDTVSESLKALLYLDMLYLLIYSFGRLIVA